MPDTAAITIIEDAIHNPDDLRHFMVFEDVPCGATATVMGMQIACAGCDRDTALKLKEVGKKIYNPVLYFPRDAVDMEQFEKSEKTSHCPLKGTATFYNARLKDQVLENIAWSYEEVLPFDERLETIKDRIAFDAHKVHIFEIR